MQNKVLYLDDEPANLIVFRRQFRDTLDVKTAEAKQRWHDFEEARRKAEEEAIARLKAQGINDIACSLCTKKILLAASSVATVAASSSQTAPSRAALGQPGFPTFAGSHSRTRQGLPQSRSGRPARLQAAASAPL